MAWPRSIAGGAAGPDCRRGHPSNIGLSGLGSSYQGSSHGWCWSRGRARTSDASTQEYDRAAEAG